MMFDSFSRGCQDAALWAAAASLSPGLRPLPPQAQERAAIGKVERRQSAKGAQEETIEQQENEQPPSCPRDWAQHHD
jgi:hypothetical protein